MRLVPTCTVASEFRLQWTCLQANKCQCKCPPHPAGYCRSAPLPSSTPSRPVASNCSRPLPSPPEIHMNRSRQSRSELRDPTRRPGDQVRGGVTHAGERECDEQGGWSRRRQLTAPLPSEQRGWVGLLRREGQKGHFVSLSSDGNMAYRHGWRHNFSRG